jgi:hypothetical protein
MELLRCLLFAICLSALNAFGQSMHIDESFREFRKNVSSLENKIDDLQKSIDALIESQKGLSIKQNISSIIEDSKIKGSIETNLPEENIDKKNEKSLEVISVLDSETPLKETEISSNSLRFSYAICIPHDADYRSYNMEYQTGHSIALSYQRDYESFFWGVQLGAKFFESDKMSAIPIVGELPASGNNYSANFSLLAGSKHNLSEKVFIRGNIGAGINHSWDEIMLGSTTVEFENTNFYGALNLGVGVEFSELMSLLLFYEINAHGPSGRLRSRVFSQAGLSLGVHY